jgi:hypothetical protein
LHLPRQSGAACIRRVIRACDAAAGYRTGRQRGTQHLSGASEAVHGGLGNSLPELLFTNCATYELARVSSAGRGTTKLAAGLATVGGCITFLGVVSWGEFLGAHWGAIAACDFFTVEVLTLRGLVRYHVFIVIDLATRRVEVGGIVRQPTGAWMVQVARNLLDSEEGFLLGKTHLFMDRDPLFAHDFRSLLGSAGVEPVRLPARSPNLNAYAERFILSIKSECLDRLILLGEGHLRLAVREYVAHYNTERPHQGLGGRFVMSPCNENHSGPIVSHERLGGLLRFYQRQPA